jgi:arylsulfatase A-like enzyme
LLLVVATICAPSCAEPRHAEQADRPNVLWVVWDTVRADHLSVYGYQKPTTPALEQWAKNARVFERCAATAGQTLPSTASMFTGLHPSEHASNSRWKWLDDRFTTIAELFLEAGYRTYLYSANAYISTEHNFQRGFQVEEHPWDEQYADEALRIVRAKLEWDQTGKREQLQSGAPGKRRIKASGVLARKGLESWLERTEGDKPFFAFLNYMEAHRKRIPPRAYRERMLTAEQVAASYALKHAGWEYTFGLQEYSDAKIELINGVYDAAIAELDDLLADLLARLEASGHLENTVVVLTSDHGEHLGDHHMIDHQFSVYEGLIHVPLIVHYPDRFPPGRDSRPVSPMDLFPTLLELAGIDPPEGLTSRAVSLLSPKEDRALMAEYPAFHPSVDIAAKRYEDWDPRPWRRRLHAIYADEIKYIEAHDGHSELYRLSVDPAEANDLVASESDTARRMSELLHTYVDSLNHWMPTTRAPEMSPEQYERLKALGYVGME